jgi:hypothetical protein
MRLSREAFSWLQQQVESMEIMVAVDLCLMMVDIVFD